MASHQLLVLVILGLVGSSIQNVENNKVDSQEESPLADVAKEILKEKNLENIGGMVNSFIQSGGAKQLMDGVLQNLASNGNSGQILESLGSLFNSGSGNSDDKDQKQGASKSGKKSNDDINPVDILSGLGSIVGAMQGAGGDGGQGNPAALLQGLGSLLGGANNNAGGENNAAALLQGLGALLGSASQEKNKKSGEDDGNAGALLQGLGSLLGAAAGGNQGDGNDAGALLQGLGSLLGGSKGGEAGGLNPEVIGNMINMFANSQGDQKKTAKPSKSKSAKKASSGKTKSSKPKKDKDPNSKSDGKGIDGLVSLAGTFLGREGTRNEKGGIDVDFLFANFPLFVQMGKAFGGPGLKKYFDPLDDIIYVYKAIMDDEQNVNFKKLAPRIVRIHTAYKELVAPHIQPTGKTDNQDESFDLGSIINIASTFLNQANNNNGKGESNFMDYLPMIMNTINAFTGEEAQARADSHSGHSWALPPMLERIHIYFDNFMNSEMGKKLSSYIGDQKAFRVFQDEKGKFSYDKFEELIENHSFRRHWIQQLANRIVEFLRFISDEKIQSQYIDMGITFTNSFLQNSGFPKSALLDMKHPVESISSFANFAASKYLDTDTHAREYVEPAVRYTQELLQMARASLAPGSKKPKELTEKLTDTLNMEIIEPITRVNRAYRFAKSQPSCDRYIFCIINQKESPNDPGRLPDLRKALYKGSSLIMGWFLSSHTGTSYWDLYAVITESKNCQAFHNESCNDFYQEEVKATTEYIHNEL